MGKRSKRHVRLSSAAAAAQAGGASMTAAEVVHAFNHAMAHSLGDDGWGRCFCRFDCSSPRRRCCRCRAAMLVSPPTSGAISRPARSDVRVSSSLAPAKRSTSCGSRTKARTTYTLTWTAHALS